MWVSDLHYHCGLVRIAFGVYNNSDNMKDIIKQSIIGAIYMFAITAFMAVVVITLYTMVGR
jgi:hypothetical protein